MIIIIIIHVCENLACLFFFPPSSVLLLPGFASGLTIIKQIVRPLGQYAHIAGNKSDVKVVSAISVSLSCTFFSPEATQMAII